MTMTNTERQKAFRERRSSHFLNSVSSAEVLRAVRIHYGACMAKQGIKPNFENWRKEALDDRTGGMWRAMMPTDIDPDGYPAILSLSQRKLLAKVAAVCNTVLIPS